MHLILLLLSFILAWGLRHTWANSTATWSDRWQRAVGTFLFSPLLILTTAIAILCMGPRGQMGHLSAGWGSYLLAAGFLGIALVWCLTLLLEARRSLHQIRHYDPVAIQDTTGRLLNSPIPFVAQVGFWRSELVISQGLLDTLDADHLNAVIMHEQAHHYYRDTFWFFWLGCLRRLTAWLPQTEALWQELLLLRELRADRWAAQRVDSLLLAEALLSVVSAPVSKAEQFCAPFNSVAGRDRVTERMNALLEQPVELPRSPFYTWIGLLWTLLPLATVPFHG